MNGRFRWTVWRVLAAVILAAGAVAAVRRFTLGLGATTNLTDGFPWGIWVAFDVMCGVGLAAGGFTISGMVYLFGREKYRPLARPAIFTAFIGYLMVVGGLMFDLGHPWRIWHPIIMWNHHSVMFEVGWCVTLYTVVLAAEVSSPTSSRCRSLWRPFSSRCSIRAHWAACSCWFRGACTSSGTRRCSRTCSSSVRSESGSR
jgi:Ni/Fe-hydrogenase subunit HybB-like protein